MTEPRYPFVHIDVSSDESDYAGSTLFELGAQGLEERDASTLVKGKGDLVTLVASFASREEADAALAELPAEWNARIEEIVGDAWRDEWKKHFKPFEICAGIYVCPPWEEVPPEAKRVLVLEPGRAFGTGLHETTSLVAKALEKYHEQYRGKPILDVGCGTGILAFIALLFGASNARLTDNDGDVLDVVRENAERNQLQAKIVADTAELPTLPTYDFVVANIEAYVLKNLYVDLAARVRPGGTLILSGILVPQREDVLAHYKGFELTEAFEKGEWVALVLKKT